MFLGRRAFLGAAAAGIGVAGIGSWAGASAQESGAGPSPGDVVDLGEQGVSPGDDLTPYLEDHWTSGVEVRIPGGRYELSDPEALGISAGEDAWLVGDSEVMLEHGDQRVEFNIEADASAHVRMQNLTLKGVDQGENSKVRVEATGSDSVIELVNVNRPDGTEEGLEATGVYVPGPHAGVARFVNCHFEGFSDNGIYADSPGEGEDGDGNGPVEVYGGLYRNNDTSGVRIGSDDSRIVGAVVVNDATAPGVSGGNAQRGIRIREPGENLVIDNCDVSQSDISGAAGLIEVENESFSGPLPSDATVTDTRFRNDSDRNVIDCESDEYDITGQDIQISGDGSYELEGSGPFDGVVSGGDAEEPRTTKRWVTYDGIEEPSDTTTETPTETPTPTPEPTATPTPEPAYDHRLVVRTFADPASEISYRFVVDGSVVGGENAELDDNDSITDNGDGTLTVEGITGNGYTDDFQFDGEIVDWQAEPTPESSGDGYELVLDGDVVSPEELSAGPSVPPLSVTTGAPDDRTDERATLTGTLDSLGGADSATVGFEWGEAGSGLPNTTPAGTADETGEFTAGVAGLTPETEYEFRALATAGGEDAQGETSSFTTPAAESPETGGSPSIDTFDVTEAGSRNAGADILAKWAVSDGDGDLASVLVQVVDAGGTVVDAATSQVSGSEAYNVDYFKIRNARGLTFDVELTVTDAAGNTATTARTVTE